MDEIPIRFALLTLLLVRFFFVFFWCVSPADAQPTEAEREIWEEVDVVLKDAKAILDELQAYKGAGPDIREVRSSTPSSQDTLVQNYKETCIYEVVEVSLVLYQVLL